MDTLYVEKGVRDHPRAQSLLARYPKATLVEVERYGEVFNRRAQNFRIQKKRPALILARKHGECVLPTPPGYTIGSRHNYYFSHMLNCLYDCRYCFLQGMYQSAHYVFFVNFEDFEAAIDRTLEKHPGEEVCFFSGYDCDSLAMERLTGFAEHFLPFFAKRPQARLELRTKSLQTRVLSESDPVPNVVAAYTLTPDAIAREVEHGAPPVEQRLKRVSSLAQQGWMTGFRFDPLIAWPGFSSLYGDFLPRVFSQVEASRVHSVTLGPMRFPKAMYDKIIRLYPDEPLYARQEWHMEQGQAGYGREVEQEMVETVLAVLREQVPEEKIFLQV